MLCDAQTRRSSCATVAIFTSLHCAFFVGCNQKAPRAIDAQLVTMMAADPSEDPPSQLYWPGWRGTNTSGVSNDVDLPLLWSGTSGIRWQVTVPGRGNSSPVVCGNHILLTSALDDGTLEVYSFDRRNGASRWRTKAGVAKGATHAKNGHASASVATNGRQVFASFGSSGLFGLDVATGQELWHADLGQLEHQWGTASSPVLFGQLVIQLCESESNSSIAAFDQTTGQPVWRTSRASHGTWSTPVLVEATDAAGQARTELVINGTGADRAGNGLVIAYDPTSGKELWRARGTTDIVCPTAIVGGGLVISTSGRNGPIMAIQPGGNGDVTATHVVWNHTRGGAYVPTGVAHGNRLFCLADGGVLNCFNLKTGESIWRQRLRGNFTASLILCAGRIYAVGEQGDVYVFAAADKFDMLATNSMGQRILSTPAIAVGDIFIRGEDSLCCIGGLQDVVREKGEADRNPRPNASAEIHPEANDSDS
jgi:outer membrane protein assembly factor BamB